MKKAKTLIYEFLPTVLWYNVCYYCAWIEQDTDTERLQILHDADKDDLNQRLKDVEDALIYHKTLFDDIIQIHDQFHDKQHQTCIELRDTYFRKILFVSHNFDDFFNYLSDIYCVKSIDIFSELLHIYCQNISEFISNDVEGWRQYLKHIYNLFNTDHQQQQQWSESHITVIHTAIHPIYKVIVDISNENEAKALQTLIQELPSSYDKTDILMHVLLNKNNYLLCKHPETFLDLIVEQILLNNTNMASPIEVKHPLNDKTITLKTYKKLAQYQLQTVIETWMNNVSGKQYAVTIIRKHNIPWKCFGNTIALMVQKASKDMKDADDLSMKSFCDILKFITDKDIPMEGRKSIIPHLVSFWRETPKNKFVLLNTLFMTLFELLFIQNTDEDDVLYDAITKSFRNICAYNQYFYEYIDDEPSMDRKTTFNIIECDVHHDNHACNGIYDEEKMFNYENTISGEFLRIPAIDIKLMMNQESLYRFGKTLQDKTHPFGTMLLKRSSGVYYLMGIVMQRLHEYTKCDLFFSECLRLHIKNGKKENVQNDSNVLKAFYIADIAWRYYNNHKQKQSEKCIKTAMDLSTEGYINLIYCVINAQERAINDVIKYMENQSSNYAFYGRFVYAQWLHKNGEYDKSKHQYDIIMKQYGNDNKTKGNVVMMNGLVHYEYGQLLMHYKQKDEAKTQFRTALMTKPCCPNIHQMCNCRLKILDANYDPNKHSYNDTHNIETNIMTSMNDIDGMDDKESKNHEDDKNDINDDDHESTFVRYHEDHHTQCSMKNIPFSGNNTETHRYDC